MMVQNTHTGDVVGVHGMNMHVHTYTQSNDCDSRRNLIRGRITFLGTTFHRLDVDGRGLFG